MSASSLVDSRQMGHKKLHNQGVFAADSNFEHRYIPDYQRLAEVVNACKVVGFRLVLTMGTFDMIHIGHFMYLEKAKALGDILIVGVDSDEKVCLRKGPSRPIVPQEERVQMLTHLRHVNIVTLKPQDDPKWNLIQLVQPDVLAASQGTYDAAAVANLKQFCKEVVIIEPQAATSTTAKLRQIHISLAKDMKSALTEAIEQTFARVIQQGKQ
jgi:rfaE bifunctional protein nucleotidyltransferase chain/domain